MSTDLTPVIAASARWLLAAFPPPAGAVNQALAEAQARQAADLAATLRYSTVTDIQLLHLLAPSGSHQLDWLTGSHHTDDSAWRTWVDETVVSWAACLLADPTLAARANRLNGGKGHGDHGDLRRLTAPRAHETEAAALLRHPDLLESVAALHRPQLMALLNIDGARQ